MNCVRCLIGEAEVVAHAPDGSGAWEIYRCRRCNYGWRSSEPQTITDASKRDSRFQLVDVDLEELLSPCPVQTDVGGGSGGKRH
jgi:vanillate/4-hydroxybenzoate decarboxylase subunit D